MEYPSHIHYIVIKTEGRVIRMKKMQCFVFGTLLMLVSILLFTRYRYHTMSYSLEDEIGDSSILHGIELQASIENYDGVFVDVTIGEREVTYAIHTKEKFTSPSILVDVVAKTKRLTTPQRLVNSYDTNKYVSCDSDEECGENPCAVKEYQQDEGEISLLLFMQDEIKTGLTVYSDETLLLVYQDVHCAISEYSEKEYDRIYYPLPYRLLEKEEVAYLMLQVDPHMEGTLDIYQIQSHITAQKGREFEATSVFQLDIQRGTSGLLTSYMDKNYLLIWANEEAQLYIFDEAMQLLETIDSSIPLSSDEPMKYYQHEQYLLIQQGTQVVCFDIMSGKSIASYSVEENANIVDMIYHDEILYLALGESMETETTATTGNFLIQAYDEQELLYQGSVHLYDHINQCSRYEEDACAEFYDVPFHIQQVRFVRDAS